eukprot:INCI20245.1.p1 GENE.INCI20245.1~~INCI20245.1.p1  ORF type:complete len:599 (-),score=169.67 INCI20245.1:179-1975(-)
MADAAGAAAALKAEGNKCLAAKDFDGAIAKYSEAIALDPANHVFYSNRSAAYLSKGDANSALADADKCIEVKPDWPKGYGRKGAAHHSLQQYEQAFDAYEKGLAVAPNDAALKKGMQSVEKAMLSSMPGGGGNPLAGLFNAANIERLRAHPTTGPFFEDPSFNQLMQNVGSNPNGMQLMQSDPRFLQCLQVLLQADPMMQQAQQQAQDEENRKKEAEVQATPKGYGSWAPKAKEAEPEEEEEELTAEELAEKEREAAAEAERQKVRDAADAKKAEGNDLYKAKDFAGAIAKYNEAIELDPTNITYYNNIAAVQMAQKDFEAVRASCDKALEIGKSNRASFEDIAKCHLRKATSFMKEKRFDEAIASYENALLEHKSKDIELKLKKAQKLKKKAAADAYINPELAQEHKAKGNVFFKAGKFPDAVKEYSEAIKRDPSNKFLYQNRATAYSKLMVFDAALQDCEKALKIDPNFVKAHARSGYCHKGLSKLHKALECFEAGLAIEPNDAQCLKGLQETQAAIQKNMYEGSSEEQRQRALEDPEIRQIYGDPLVRATLEQMSKDPDAYRKAMENPGMRQKINKLMAAGLLSFGGPGAGGGQK